MASYIIKNVTVNGRTAEVITTYSGANDSFSEFADSVKPYKSEKLAKKAIERKYGWYLYKKVAENTWLENDLHTNTSIVIEVKE